MPCYCNQQKSGYGYRSDSSDNEDDFMKQYLQRSDYSGKSRVLYDNSYGVDDHMAALQQKGCKFLGSDLDDIPADSPVYNYARSQEFLFGNSNFMKKASDLIDYIPQSEFLKKMKQQFELSSNDQPSFFSSLDDDPESERTGEHLRHRSCPPQQSRMRTNNDQMVYQVSSSNPRFSGDNKVSEKKLQSGARLKSGDKKSEHISRSRKPVKCRERRKRKSDSPEKCESDFFEPTLKKPYENSCERCWRYASPARSPVNKPDQKFDPNFRRGHSCYDFQSGDGEFYDIRVSPCKNLQPITSREKLQQSPGFSPSVLDQSPELRPVSTSWQRTPQARPQSASAALQKSPDARSPKSLSIWQKSPKTQPEADSTIWQRSPEYQPLTGSPVGGRTPEDPAQRTFSSWPRSAEYQPRTPSPVCQRTPEYQPPSGSPLYQRTPEYQPPSGSPLYQRTPEYQPPSGSPLYQRTPEYQPRSASPVCQRTPEYQPSTVSPVGGGTPEYQSHIMSPVGGRTPEYHPATISPFGGGTPNYQPWTFSPVGGRTPEDVVQRSYTVSPRYSGNQPQAATPVSPTPEDLAQRSYIARPRSAEYQPHAACPYQRSPENQPPRSFSIWQREPDQPRAASPACLRTPENRAPRSISLWQRPTEAFPEAYLPPRIPLQPTPQNYIPRRRFPNFSPVVAPGQRNFVPGYPPEESYEFSMTPSPQRNVSEPQPLDQLGEAPCALPQGVAYSQSPRTQSYIPDVCPGDVNRCSQGIDDINLADNQCVFTRPRQDTMPGGTCALLNQTLGGDTAYPSRQPIISKSVAPCLKTIPEATDSDISQTKLPCAKKSPSKSVKVKSPQKSPVRQGIPKATTPVQSGGGSPSKGTKSPKRSPSGVSPGKTSKSPRRSVDGVSPVKSSKSPSRSGNGSPKPTKPKSPSPKPGTSKQEVVRTPVKSPRKSPVQDDFTITRTPTPERRPQSPGSPLRGDGTLTAGPEEYVNLEHEVLECTCDPDGLPIQGAPGNHIMCCHCNWDKYEANSHLKPPPKNMANIKGYDGRTYICPHRKALHQRDEEPLSGTVNPSFERDCRLLSELQNTPPFEESFQGASRVLPPPSPPNPTKYIVLYMTKCKENKRDDEVEVLVEELAQTCPNKIDSRTKDLTEKMKKIMECPSDSMALRFQKGVSDQCKIPQSSRTLYF